MSSRRSPQHDLPCVKSSRRHSRGAMIDRGPTVGSLAATPAESATLVVLLMLLGLMITSSLHLYRFGRSGRLHPSGTRHRYPEISTDGIQPVARPFIHPARWNILQHRRRSINGRGRQHVVTMGDYIIPIDIVNGLPTPMRLTLTKKMSCHTSLDLGPTGIPLSSTARSVTRPIGISPPKCRPLTVRLFSTDW
jgi:hypothetical protein